MIYSSGEKKLNCIRKVLENDTNDVWIAQDIEENGNGQYYTLLVVREHEAAKSFMETIEQGLREGRNSQAEVFTCRDEFCVIYPYRKERLLEQFYESEACSKKECGQICENLIAECISAREVWPVLYMILKQKQIHLEKDNSIYFGYQFDMRQLDRSADERACVMVCADIILDLMRKNAGMEKTIGRRLIGKKMQKEGYFDFVGLLRDTHLDANSWEKVGPKERIMDFFQKHQRTMIHILLGISIVLGVIALLMIFSQMIFGDIPFLRIFSHSFRVIGSESLLK